MPYAGPSGGNAEEVLWGSNPLSSPVQHAAAGPCVGARGGGAAAAVVEKRRGTLPRPQWLCMLLAIASMSRRSLKSAPVPLLLPLLLPLWGCGTRCCDP